MPIPLLYETHMHTRLCKHARGEIEDYAQVAWERGLKGITVTCHNPMPENFEPSIRMTEGEFGEYLSRIAQARSTWEGRVEVRLGLECDCIPGQPGGTGYLRDFLAAHPFDYVLGSVHASMGVYMQQFWRGDVVGFQKRYFEHLAEAAETGLFDALAHPDVVKNCHPQEWDLERLEGDIEQTLDRIAATGVTMELNTSGLYKPVPEMNPGVEILRRMGARKIPVVVGGDAHGPEEVGRHFVEALSLLAEVGFREVSYFLGRKRQTVSIAEAQGSLIFSHPHPM